MRFAQREEEPKKDDGIREEPTKHGDSIFINIGIMVTVIIAGSLLIIGYIAITGAFIFGVESGELSDHIPEPTTPIIIISPTIPPSQKPTPTTIPTSVPTKKLPFHAEGDPRKCGTCHSYPDTSYRIHPNPTSTRTSQYIPPSYIPSSNTMPIPDDYYSQPCELPTDQSMQEYLANSEWLDDYDAGSWDCSQMAAYIEFSLENCGYHTIIAVAETDYSEYGHAWILVEFKQGWLAYECTGRFWVYPDELTARSYDPYGYVYWNPSFYTAGVQYESIYDLWNGYKQYRNAEEEFLQEYGWWVER